MSLETVDNFITCIGRNECATANGKAKLTTRKVNLMHDSKVLFGSGWFSLCWALCPLGETITLVNMMGSFFYETSIVNNNRTSV